DASADRAMPIARVALPVAAQTTFDYWCPESLAIARGSVVRVRLGTRNLVGVVTELAAEPRVSDAKLAPIGHAVDLPRIDDDVLALAAFVSEYYQEPPGLAYALALPPLVRERRTKKSESLETIRPAHALNAEQRAATDAIVAARDAFATLLLHGVTGSGKTEVYLAAADGVFADGKQVLMLVP